MFSGPLVATALRQACLHRCRAAALLSLPKMLLTPCFPPLRLKNKNLPLESSFTPLSLFVMSVWPVHPSAPGTDEGMIWINSIPWREIKLLKFKLEHSNPPNGFAMALWCWKCILENSKGKCGWPTGLNKTKATCPWGKEKGAGRGEMGEGQVSSRPPFSIRTQPSPASCVFSFGQRWL